MAVFVSDLVIVQIGEVIFNKVLTSTITSFCYILGQGKPSGFQEQASVVVETVTKTSSMSKFAHFPPFVSDASKVTVDGNGVKKGFRNKQCSFNVDTSQAGKYEFYTLMYNV